MKTKLKKLGYFLFCKAFYKVEFKGKENIDMSRSNVLVANHVSAIDPIIIWSDIDNISIMAKEELFKFKPLGNFLRAQGGFPIARGKKDFGQVYHSVNVVRGKTPRNLLIFPEGTRQAIKKGIKAKNGATYVAAATGVPIIPIHITENIRLFKKIIVEYGKPIILNINKEDIKDKKLLNSNTDMIMKTIYSMKGDNK